MEENDRNFAECIKELLETICPKCCGLIDTINSISPEQLTGNPDFEYLVEAAIEIERMLNLPEDVYSFTLFMLLSGTYVKGYRKGRAATPLTLVVAPEEGKL